MNVRRYIFLFTILALNIPAFCQTESGPNRNIVEDLTENTAELINATGQFEIPEELNDMNQHPLNINNDDLEVLVRYNLITTSQLTSLQNYRQQFGNLLEMEELQQVDGFDKKTILGLLPYCTVQSMKEETRSHQLTLRFQKSIEHITEDYSGSNEKVLLKYRGTINKHFRISYTGEKDAGEEIFTSKKKGFDFNSFNLCYKGLSILRKIVIGDFNLEYGQGLTLWSGFAFGGGNEITGIYKYGRGIIPYTGTDENRFMRGIGLSMGRGKMIFDCWISRHAIDGNITIDSVSNTVFVTSMQTSGYHRTTSEINDEHSLTETVYGSALNYTNRNFSTGLVGYYQQLNYPLVRDYRPYSRFSFEGNKNYDVGWNYSYSKKNFILFGESSYSRSGAFAYLNGLMMSVDPKMSISFLWRSYSAQYVNLKSNAYGINSENQNEAGVYLGINYKLNRALTYSGYVDVFSFPFLKYRVSSPSNGFDLFNQLQFIPNKKFTGAFRFRKRMKQMDESVNISGLNHLSDFSYNNFRLSCRFKIDNTWEYSFRFEWITSFENKINDGEGTMISQDIFFHPMGKSYSLNFRYAVFNCPDFDTRIYEYENDVQGAFSIPFYYGNGSRFYINVNLKMIRNLTVSVRFSTSWINDEAQSSELKLQLKASFR